MSDGEDVVRDKILSLITTARGERPYRDSLGVDAHDFVFENMSALQRARVSQQIRRAIIGGIPSVELLSVSVGELPDPNSHGFLIYIVYRYQGQVGEIPVPIEGG